jgi:hypothetical protein
LEIKVRTKLNSEKQVKSRKNMDKCVDNTASNDKENEKEKLYIQTVRLIIL